MVGMGILGSVVEFKKDCTGTRDDAMQALVSFLYTQTVVCYV